MSVRARVQASRNFSDTGGKRETPRALPRVTAPRRIGPNDLALIAAMNVAEVQVVSATALDERQQARLAGALKTRLNREVRLECAVDPGLIGGAIVRSGDLLIDGSLKGKLERLATELTG